MSACIWKQTKNPVKHGISKEGRQSSIQSSWLIFTYFTNVFSGYSKSPIWMESMSLKRILLPSLNLLDTKSYLIFSMDFSVRIIMRSISMSQWSTLRERCWYIYIYIVNNRQISPLHQFQTKSSGSYSYHLVPTTNTHKLQYMTLKNLH